MVVLYAYLYPISWNWTKFSNLLRQWRLEALNGTHEWYVTFTVYKEYFTLWVMIKVKWKQNCKNKTRSLGKPLYFTRNHPLWQRDKSKIHAAMYHKIMSSLNCNRKLLLYTRDTPKYFLLLACKFMHFI